MNEFRNKSLLPSFSFLLRPEPFKTSAPNQTSKVLRNSPPNVHKIVGTNKLQAARELIHVIERLDVYLTVHAIRNKVTYRRPL